MCDPPRDADDCVIPHDHPQIQDEDILIRGIPYEQTLSDGENGRRISTGAFDASSEKYGGLSVAAKKVLECLGKTSDEWAAGRFSAVVCFPAKVLRKRGIQIGWEPLEDDRAHCNAWAASGDPFPRAKSLKKDLAYRNNEANIKRRFLD